MNKNIRVKLEMLVRVNQFCGEYAGEFSQGSLGQTLCEQLNSGLAEIEKINLERGSGSALARASVVRKAAAKKQLKLSMRQIRDAAVALELIHPGIVTRFSFNPRLSELALLAAARQMKTDAANNVESFVSCGLEADFLDRLNGEIGVFEKLVNAKNNGMGEQIRGTSGLEGKTREACALVQRLDRVMKIHFSNRRAELTEWEQTKRMRQTRKEEAVPVAVAA